MNELYSHNLTAQLQRSYILHYNYYHVKTIV